MPFITYTTVEGALSDEQKEAVTRTLGEKKK